jgi:hypothetical protein
LLGSATKRKKLDSYTTSESSQTLLLLLLLLLQLPLNKRKKQLRP